MRLFFDVWRENAALFERFMEIYSNPPILHVYYGFNMHVPAFVSGKLLAREASSFCDFELKNDLLGFYLHEMQQRIFNHLKKFNDIKSKKFQRIKLGITKCDRG